MQDKKIRHKDILKVDFINDSIKTLFEYEVEGFDLLKDCQTTINGILSGEIEKVEWSVSNARGIVIRNKQGNCTDITFSIRKRATYIKEIIFEVLEETIREKYIESFFEYFADEENVSKEEITSILNNNPEFNKLIEFDKNKYIVDNWKRIEEQIFENNWQGIDKEEILNFIDQYLKKTFEQIDDFCSSNNIDIITEIKLFNIARVHTYTARVIIYLMKLSLIVVSDIDRVLESVKKLHQNNVGVLPDEIGFKSYLFKYVDSISELEKDDNIKRRIAEYVHYEVEKNTNYYHDAKHKIQALIDTKQPKTLSIEQKTDNVEEQIKINIDSNYESLFERFKETYLFGLKVSTSLIDVTKYYDLFDKELKVLLSFAGFKSIKTKLETLREIKIKFLMSLGNAEQFIGLDRNGVYEHPKPSTFVQTKKGVDGLVQRVEELNTNLKEPLIVSRANKRVYEDIITLLDREEEMILIELRNGKSLDYSPLKDKKHNGNPTTSATVEEGVNLTHREIATLCYINGVRDLTYPQAEDLALFHGQKSRTSGKILKEKYWNVFVKEEGMNHEYNAEIYTYSNSYQSILKIIPLLENEECIKLANEYLKKSEPYKDVKSKE